MRTDPMDGGRDQDRTGFRLRGAWRSVLPVGVAAAAALFIGGSIDVVHRHQRAGKDKHDAQAAAAQTTPPGPRFVVGVTRSGTALTVRDARTGAAVGLPVAAPEGRRFERVAGDGASYVVASYGDRKVTFQHLQLADDGTPQSLTDLPKATISGASAEWSDLAVTGDRLAYVTYKGVRASVHVVSARTGAHKTWTTRYTARVGSLSWAGDTLSFVWTPVRRVNGAYTEVRSQARTLNTDGPSGDLKASKAVADLPKGSSTALISHDGKTIVAGLTTLQAYSTATGEPSKTVWKGKGEVSGLDSDGGKLLVSLSDGHLYGDGTALRGKDLADVAW